jgi:hypothetical protein
MGCFTLANRCIIRYYKNKITPCGKKRGRRSSLSMEEKKSGIKKFFEEFKAGILQYHWHNDHLLLMCGDGNKLIYMVI